MKTKNYLCWCAAVLALGLATAACAQQPQRELALTPAERQELSELLEEFVPNSPPPQALPLSQQLWLLNNLRELVAGLLPIIESERLVVCETIGDAHLEVGDVIYLVRVGNSANLRMTVVRDENTPTATNPWIGPGGGGNTIIVDPSLSGKKHANQAFKKFTPEGVGQARVDPHTGGTPEDHTFTMRRITRPTGSLCTGPADSDPLFITVPEQHATGSHHGGHAIAD